MKMRGKRLSRWNPQSASARAAEEAGIVFILSTISTSRFVQVNFCQSISFDLFTFFFIILVLKKLLQPHLKLWNGSNFTSTKTERWDFYLHASCDSNNMISQAAQKIIEYSYYIFIWWFGNLELVPICIMHITLIGTSYENKKNAHL